MKVSKEIFALSEDILNHFDAGRMKQAEIDKIKAEPQSTSSKWDQMSQDLDKEERLAAVE